MSLWDFGKQFLAGESVESPSPRKLSAVSMSALSHALKDLPVGVRGWIMLSEARSLFSSMDDQYAFGEMDEQGKANLAAFASDAEHQSIFNFMPAEGRVYFTRK